MKCPRCLEVDLLPFVLDEGSVSVEGQQCPTCRGHFLRGDELQKAQRVLKVQAVELRRVPDDDVQQAPIACPRCPTLRTMSKVRSDRDDKVTLDICPGCFGAWLDPGELNALQRQGLLSFVLGFERGARKVV